MPRTTSTKTPSHTSKDNTPAIIYTHLVLDRQRLTWNHRCLACQCRLFEGQEVTALTRVGVTPVRRLTRRDVVGLMCDRCMESAKYWGEGNLQRGLRFHCRTMVDMLLRHNVNGLREVARYPLIEETPL